MQVSSENNQLTHDDMDALQYVLKHVKGSYPDEPYRQADFLEQADPEEA